MAPLEVLGIAGSLRAGSYNRALLEAARQLAPPGMRLSVFEGLRAIPPYDQDVDRQGDPEPVAALKRAIGAADALLISSPEYNYSVPGVLKNAIDWASRPAGKSVLHHKPVAIMGATTGLWGTVRAQLALRQIFLFTESPVLLKPEVLVSQAERRFGPGLELLDDTSRTMLRQLLEALRTWVERFR